MINVGDKFVLHSVNGMDYDIKIVNMSDYREPDMKYAIDVYDANGMYAGDVLFVGEDFFSFSNCEKVSG